MKTSLKLFALGMILLGFGMNANAQELGTSTSRNADAKAKVVQTLAITKDRDLNFGVFAGLSTGTSTVIIAATATGARTGTADLVASSSGYTPISAKFTVTGAANQSVTITVPADGVVSLKKGGASENAMTTNSWLTDLSNLSNTSLGETGSVEFHVGATLTVNASQPVGEYVGSFEVTANYN